MRVARAAVAFLVAPLATPLVLLVSLMIGTLVAGDTPGPLDRLSPYLVLFAVLTYPSVLLLGIPAFLLFQRYGCQSIIAYAIGGASIGLITAIAWTAILKVDAMPAFSALFVLAGSVSAVLFRIIIKAGT